MKKKFLPWFAGAALCLAACSVGCALTGDTPAVFVKKLFSAAYVPEQGGAVSLAGIAAFGFLTSFHCVGMCGGVAASQCAGRDGRLLPAALYNLGRVVSYTFTGAAAGLLGAAVSLNAYLSVLMPLVCAAIALVMALKLLGLFRAFSLGGHGHTRAMKRLDGLGPFIVGALTGFLPCAMMQMAQIRALMSGSALYGAAVMFVFALASSPVLFGFGYLSSALSARWQSVTVKLAALFIIYTSVNMIIKGIRNLGAI